MSHVKQKGFTLIELLLAMTFISVLLLAIALTILQISAIYNRGMTLKEVNLAGRALSADIEKSIAVSASFPITGAGSMFVAQGTWGGRLCVNQYAYVWNYGAAIAAGNTSPNFNVFTPVSTEKIRFVKAPDIDGHYCTTPSTPITATGAVELLNVGDHDIAVHNVSMSTSTTATDSKTGQQLYTVTFTIGTNDTAALLTGGTGCKPPNQAGADPVYCVVQTFSFVARAGNVQ